MTLNDKKKIKILYYFDHFDIFMDILYPNKRLVMLQLLNCKKLKMQSMH